MLEDMLWGCVMEFIGSWDRYISLIEFAYNNSYQSSIDMTPYELCMAGDVDVTPQNIP